MNIDPGVIGRVTLIPQPGFHIALDDDVAKEMHDKQQMTVALREITVKAENSEEENKTSLLELILALYV
jgi:hypothetical protein